MRFWPCVRFETHAFSEQFWHLIDAVADRFFKLAEWAAIVGALGALSAAFPNDMLVKLIYWTAWTVLGVSCFALAHRVRIRFGKSNRELRGLSFLPSALFLGLAIVITSAITNALIAAFVAKG